MQPYIGTISVCPARASQTKEIAFWKLILDTPTPSEACLPLLNLRNLQRKADGGRAGRADEMGVVPVCFIPGLPPESNPIPTEASRSPRIGATQQRHPRPSWYPPILLRIVHFDPDLRCRLPPSLELGDRCNAATRACGNYALSRGNEGARSRNAGGGWRAVMRGCEPRGRQSQTLNG